ncbi:MAG: helix-turn-helix domain-containing protein [Mesorhizobium sp.]|uniref:helix-turn-helix domain-containing protein n=1 Tax=Mesorhizobium sp. TaxID=1871066 RepID=UPI0011F7B110|nr:MAG: helix-turn-helix domain-containing protein [Mesorhizobium sp.]
MNPATLAERWGCSGQHIRNLIASGELPSFKLGGKLLRIRGEDVERFECQGRSNSGQSPDTAESSPPSGAKEPAADALSSAPTIKKRRPAVARLDRRR